MKLLTISLFLLTSISGVAAETPLAEILKLDGRVSLLGKNAITKQPATKGTELYAGDLITTGPRGRAKIIMFDGSLIIIDPKSHIALNSKYEINQGEGKSYFKIRERKKTDNIKIVTNFVVIGVKGTSFVVSTTVDDKRITMNEGFDAYEQELKKEFVKYVKSFDLSEGRSISFDGARTVESRNNEDEVAEINHFESF